MSTMEVVLLAAGVIVFLVSFLLPAGRDDEKHKNKELVREEIKNFVSEEMSGVKSRVDNAAEEAADLAAERAERSLERISNEKIMAVSQYSDTVLEEINKNHQEVVFLYDMLNDKHKNLKQTLKEINRTVREAEDSFQKLSADRAEPDERKEEGTENQQEKQREETLWKDSGVKPDEDSAIETEEQGENYNDRILALYAEGRSKVEIARELDLGVGEVKLVIDLHKRMS